MAAFGKFVELTFVNTTSPPINADNLNEMERVLGLVDEELQRSQTICFSDYAELLYNNNSKLIDAFTDSTEWTNSHPSSGTLSDSSYYNIIGPSAIVITEDDNVAGFIGMYKTYASSLNLAAFNDGSASTTDDCIVFTFYVDDSTIITNVQFRLGDDFSNCYLISFTGLVNGWNSRYPQKSDFTTTGSPTGWNDITYFRCVAYTQASGSGVFLAVQYAQLARQDPVNSGYSNFSQLEQASGYENIFDIIYDTWAIVRDVSDNLNRFGFMYLNTFDYANALNVYDNCIDFVCKCEMYPKHAGVTNSIAWYIDGNNYAELYVQSDILTLNTYVGGVLDSSDTDSFTSNLEKNERIFLYLEKRGQNFKGYARKGGERLRYVNAVTTISADSDGDVRIGGSAQYSQTLITDISISSNSGSVRLENDGNFEVIQKTEVQSFTSNTFVDVADLKAKLKPNSVYEITVFLSANNLTSATPDIKTSWVLTGDGASQLTMRHGKGPSLSMTDNNNCNYVSRVSNLTTTIGYGIEGTGSASSVTETFLLKTEQDGGEIQLQAAQYTSDAGNPTTISANSFMKVQKVS